MDFIPTTGLKVVPRLRGVAKTLLIPLAARATDAKSRNPILGDLYANDILNKIEYDVQQMKLSPLDSGGVALRTRQFDRWTTLFIKNHRHCTILHLACGLDSRMQRVPWGGSGVRWIDVDLPEVITLRRQIMPTSFQNCDYQLLAASVTDTRWLEEIPKDRPTLVIMEGLLSYLEEKDVNRLILRLVERFSQGELVFECINSAVLSSLQKRNLEAVVNTGAIFQWAVDDLCKVQDIHPHLQLLESVRFCEAVGVEKFPYSRRAILYLMSWVPSLRDSARFVRFSFQDRAM